MDLVHVLVAGVVAKLQENVLVIGAVGAYAVAEVSNLLLPGDVKFKTCVLHVTHVAPGQVVADVCGQGHGHEHAVGALVVVVQ